MNRQHPYDSHQLKQVLHRDEATEWLHKTRDWVQAHLEAVLIGAVLLAAAIFGGSYLVKAQGDKALAAARALNEAQSVFEQAGGLPGDQALQGYNQAYAKYQAVAGGYEGTPQAQAARLGQANALLAQGKGAEAEREYAALDTRKVDDPLAALAAYGRARSLELQGKLPDAATAYDLAATSYPNSAVAGAAKAAALRLKGVASTPKKG